MNVSPAIIHIQLNAQLVWEYAYDHAGEQWIAACHPLNLTVIGETFAELQESMNEAQDLLFSSLLEDGELDAFLHQKGWSLKQQLPPMGHAVRFDVPFDLRRVGSPRELTA